MDKENQTEKKNKNLYSIVFIGSVFIVLFALMISYICVFSISNKQEMMDNSYNTHQALLKKQNSRGSIYSADNQILARTIKNDNGDEIREYPYEKVFAHIIGFSSHGRSGIEDMANYYLINSNISINSKANAYENEEKFPGDNLYTTLNTKLQETAYEALSAHKGAVIVSDVRTGEILAMVSKPDFDPNNLDKEWVEMTTDEDNTQLLNRATQGIYPPGSTFKIMTALEYFRENGENYKNYHYSCNGKFTFGDSTINCFHGESHGNVDFTLSFAKSCNSSFANMAVTLDRDSFNNTLSGLLFGSELPWEMNHKKSTAICNEGLSDNDIMQLGIGQGKTTVTPLHMHLITSAIANDGELVNPRVMDRVVTEEGKVIKSFYENDKQRLLTEEEATFLRDLMHEVVEKGTASKLKGQSYTAAGKTGSAEFKDSTSDSHAWFTGFAPYENPEIAVTIIVENAGSGGEFAVPIAKRIFDKYFS
jgi:peptidoglycan glycosyltransferase